MGLFNNITRLKKGDTKKENPAETVARKEQQRLGAQVIKRARSIVRSDIKTWKNALTQAQNIDTPKRILLMRLYDDIMLDALLTSQVENRDLPTVSTPFNLKKQDGTIDEESTKKLQNSKFYIDITKHMLEADKYGNSLVENSFDNGVLSVSLIPRTNVVPNVGRFLPDVSSDKYIEYRKLKEFGIWLLEFDTNSLGLLNKSVPHVLFKKFAQSCWSELCEIYGIPPRTIKTNTQDPIMLNRAEQMMRDWGASTWAIIDETEELNFARGADTNGDVFNNLMHFCNNEISLLFSGAVIGQDTKNGNESKEKVSVGLLEKLVDSDRQKVEIYWNNIVIPALYKIGYLPDGLTFKYVIQENPEKLWNMTKDVLQYKDVDNEWILNKFGIPVSDKPQAGFFE